MYFKIPSGTYLVLCWWPAAASALGLYGWLTGWRYVHPENTPSPYRHKGGKRWQTDILHLQEGNGSALKNKNVVCDSDTGCSIWREVAHIQMRFCSANKWVAGQDLPWSSPSAHRFSSFFLTERTNVSPSAHLLAPGITLCQAAECCR